MAAITSASSRRRANLPLSFSAQAPSPSQCEGWLQICLNRIRNARTRPLRWIPSVSAMRVGEIVHAVLVERGLPAAESAIGLDLGLLREVGDDGAIGLEAPQDVGPHEIAQRSVGTGWAGCEALRVARKLLLGAEQARQQEVEERPQVAEMVLDRRAGQGDARARGQLLGRPRLLRARVLDGLRFVEDDQVPRRRREGWDPQQRAVARDDEIRPCERRWLER